MLKTSPALILSQQKRKWKYEVEIKSTLDRRDDLLLFLFSAGKSETNHTPYFNIRQASYVVASTEFCLPKFAC